jgi:putative alpha-1,2-mannosidase
MQYPLKPMTTCRRQPMPARWIALARWTALAAFLTLAVCNAQPLDAGASSPVASVNPLIGTGGDPDDGINVFPGATTPFGMVQLSPDTEDHGFG